MILIKEKTNLIVRKYCDFSHIFDSFDWDITQCQYYAHIRDKSGNLIAIFNIIHGGDSIILMLDETVTRTLPTGEFLYDVLQNNESGFKSIIIEGTVKILSGSTQIE